MSFGIGQLGAIGRLGHAPLTGVGAHVRVARDFVAQMRAGTSDLVLAIVSDSTGNEYTDHFFKFIEDHLLPAAPAYLGEYQVWYDAGSTYQQGVAGGYSGVFNALNGATLFEDTFTRADGSVGTTTSGGQTWGSNTQVIASNRVAVPAGGGVLYTAADHGSDNRIYEMDFEALSSGTYRIEGLYNLGNDKGVFATVGKDGMNLYQKVAAGTTELARQSIIPALTVGQTYKAQLIVRGLFVGFRIVGVKGACVGAFLTSSDKAELGQKCYWGGPATNGRYDNTRITELANTRALRVYNGSHPGATVDYHATRLASMIPEEPDLVWIALGHNNDGTDTPEQFLARLDDYVAGVRALYPDVPVLVSTENARTDASASAAAARFAALRGAWASRGWGFEEVELPTAAWTGLLMVDGIHPTEAGHDYWATVDKAHFGV